MWRVLLLMLVGCGSQVPQHAAPPATAAFELPTLQVSERALPHVYRQDGVVEAVDQATLAAQTAGRVTELPFDVGDLVEAGQVVARFTDVEQRGTRAQAQAQVAAATAALREATSEYQRVANLVERSLVSVAQLDQATARLKAARAAEQAANALLTQAAEQVDYTTVRAPYSGIVTQRHVEVGETVSPGQPLISGLSLERLRVRLDLPQSPALRLTSATTGRVVLSDGRLIEGARLVIFPYADALTLSFTARLELPAGDHGLRPGQAVSVELFGPDRSSLRIPVGAVLARGEVRAVYVVDSARTISLRQVRLGPVVDQEVEILAGLAAGDEVAVDAAEAQRWLLAQREVGT